MLHRLQNDLLIRGSPIYVNLLTAYNTLLGGPLSPAREYPVVLTIELFAKIVEVSTVGVMIVAKTCCCIGVVHHAIFQFLETYLPFLTGYCSDQNFFFFYHCFLFNLTIETRGAPL